MSSFKVPYFVILALYWVKTVGCFIAELQKPSVELKGYIYLLSKHYIPRIKTNVAIPTLNELIFKA